MDLRQTRQSNVLDISWGTILKLSFSALLLYIIFLIKNILVWLIFALIISLFFNPVIDLLERLRVPRVLGTLSTYLLVFGFITLVLYGTSPFFLNEIQRFSQLFPRYFETLAPPLESLGIVPFTDMQTFFNVILRSIEKISANFLSALFAIFGGIFSTFFVISVAIFLSIEKRPLERTISLFLPRAYEVQALDIWERSRKKVSAWFLSRILGSIFVGAATFIVLFISNIQYPFSLALLSGLLNFIPVIGPLIIVLLIGVITALDSLLKALFVILAFILIQQIEGNILTPLLTKKFVGLSPALVLVSLAIGGELWGIMGAILAVPIAGILFEFFRDFLQKRKETKTPDL